MAETKYLSDELRQAVGRQECRPSLGMYLDKRQYVKVTQSGNLPHWHQDAKLQFITFRLADSLPQETLDQLRQEKEVWKKQHSDPWDEATETLYHEMFSKRVDKWLDAGYGECVLRKDGVAGLVTDCLKHFDGVKYNLVAYVVMPNHIHVLAQILPGYETGAIVKAWKGVTANKVNKMLGRTGELWQKEYFDRMIRSDEHFSRIIRYIEYNYYSQGGATLLSPDQGKATLLSPNQGKATLLSPDQGKATLLSPDTSKDNGKEGTATRQLGDKSVAPP